MQSALAVEGRPKLVDPSAWALPVRRVGVEDSAGRTCAILGKSRRNHSYESNRCVSEGDNQDRANR